MREDIWNRLIFDNKSYFTGRDIILQLNRIDFLRLALRQTLQSEDFKNLVDRISPIAIESIDQASEDTIDKVLEILWGSRRGGNRAKKVSQWVYERLTDSSGTNFPRSLSILLKAAKEQELSYQGLPTSKLRTERLLQGKSLEFGLREASKKRCEEIKEEYGYLTIFFDLLKGESAFLSKEQLQAIWNKISDRLLGSFEEFVSVLGEIGVVQWREKDERYKFADIYVYGFGMEPD